MGLTHAYNSSEVFDMLVHINNDTDYNTTSIISSAPFQVCLCERNIPDCSGDFQYQFPRTVYPGETFQVSVVAVGQRDGTTSGTVVSSITPQNRGTTLRSSQYLQQTSKACTTLNYTVSSLLQTVHILLDTEASPCSSFVGDILDISVSLNQTCPPGFNLSESEKSCVCEPSLHNIQTAAL